MATEAKQDIELGITKDDLGETRKAVLTLSTDKHYDGGLRSTATVFWVGHHSRQHAFGLGGGGDFSKRLKVTDRSVRATQKAIDTQHAAVFTPEAIAALTAEAKAYYNAA